MWCLPQHWFLKGSECIISLLSSHKSCVNHFHFMKVKVAQSCPVLHDRMNCSLAGSSVRGILHARILEWVGMPSPGDLLDPETEPGSPAWQADSLPSEPAGKPINQNELVRFLLQSLIFIPRVSVIQQIFVIANEPGKTWWAWFFPWMLLYWLHCS